MFTGKGSSDLIQSNRESGRYLPLLSSVKATSFLTGTFIIERTSIMHQSNARMRPRSHRYRKRRNYIAERETA